MTEDDERSRQLEDAGTPADHVGEQPPQPGVNPAVEPLGTSQKYERAAEAAPKAEDELREQLAEAAQGVTGDGDQPKAEDELREQLQDAGEGVAGDGPQPKQEDLPAGGHVDTTADDGATTQAEDAGVRTETPAPVSSTTTHDGGQTA